MASLQHVWNPLAPGPDGNHWWVTWTAGKSGAGVFLDQIFTFLLSLPPTVMLQTKPELNMLPAHIPLPSFHLAEKTAAGLQMVN